MERGGVVVDARLRLPASAGRRKSDFLLRLAGRDPVPADDMRRQEADNHYRLSFRVEPPGVTTTAEVLFKTHVLGQLTLPYLGRDEFLQGVRLQLPTLYVRLDNESVACQTFVASQCKGLIATAMLASPTSLVPLLDMDLSVEFRNERGGASQTVPVRLCSSQLAGRHALVTVAPRRFPRRIGSWLVTWMLADRPLAVHRSAPSRPSAFERSLRVTDTRFVLRWPKGNVTVARQVPPNEKPTRVGPCFLVSSREPGMAGMCQLQVHAQVPGAVQPPLLFEEARRHHRRADGVRPGDPGHGRRGTTGRLRTVAQGAAARRAVAVPGADGGFHHRRGLQAAARLRLVRRRRGGVDRSVESVD